MGAYYVIVSPRNAMEDEDDDDDYYSSSFSEPLCKGHPDRASLRTSASLRIRTLKVQEFIGFKVTNHNQG